jgi:hypothetical protein
VRVVAKRNEALKAEVARAVVAEVAKVGPAFDRAGLVAKFMGRGADRATLFRWISAEVESGRPGQAMTKKIKASAARRAKRAADPAADAAAEVGEHLPAVLTASDVLPGSGVVAVVERLRECVEIAQKIIKYSQTSDGQVRNAKLLLAGSEHLRRVIDSCVRLQESAMQLSQVERFHSLIIAEVAKESPEAAERILAAVGRLADSWGG